MSVKNIPVPFQGFDDHDSFSLEPQYATLARNVRSNRRRITRSPGGTLMAPPPAQSLGVAIVEGEVISPTTVGTVTYSHSLGVAPKAFIFATNTATSNVSNGDYATGFGLSDLTTETGSSHSSRNAATPMEVWKGYGNFAIYLIDQKGNTVLNGTVSAVTATTFDITWTVVNPITGVRVGYTALGGTGLSAKVIEWHPSGTTGNQSVTGVGFKPQLVFHLEGRQVKAVVRGAQVSLGFSVMDSAGEQWAADSHSIDSSNPSVTERGFKTNRCIVVLTGIAGSAPAFDAEASYVSMDADGFTINWVNALSAANFFGSLCLLGIPGVKVGAFAKSTGSAPVQQAITGLGFKPTWALFECADTVGTGSASGLRRSHGSSDGATTLCLSEADGNGVMPTQTLSFKSTSAVVEIIPSTSAPAKYIGNLQSFDADGFTLTWAVNNTQATSVGYVALAQSSSAIGVIRNYSQPYVGTGVTVDEKLLMLTSKTAYIYAPSTSSTGIWTPTAEAYTGTDTERFSIVNTQSIAAWSQGVDNIRQWDGTTFSNLVTVGQNHAARGLIAFADRIVSIRPFFSGVDHATQIRWCISGNVNDWSGTGSGALEIIETSQDPLVTAFVLGDRAYLAKQRELIELIWTGTNSPTFGTAPRVSGMGVLAPHSVGLGEQFAFWLGPDDIYMWDGSTLTPVGDRVYNTIDEIVDYNNIDTIQGAVYTPDSLYLLVVPPFLFVYDYRRDIWYQDDTTNFEAIAVFKVGTNFTADIDHSEFQVIGDSFVQTVRLDQTLTSYLGSPIDSYWTTKDYTAEELRGGGTQGFTVSLWNINSLREVRFQSNAGDVVEVGVSVDRGVTWQTTTVTTNSNGVGVAWFQVPFSQIRFRFRDYGTDSYEIHGSWGVDFEDSGYQYP